MNFCVRPAPTAVGKSYNCTLKYVVYISRAMRLSSLLYSKASIGSWSAYRLFSSSQSSITS